MPNDAADGSGPGLAEILSHFDIYDPAAPGRLNAVAHEAHQRLSRRPQATPRRGGYYLVAGYDEAGNRPRRHSAVLVGVP